MTETISPKQALLEAVNFKPASDSDLQFPFIIVLHTILHEFYKTTKQRLKVLDDICAHHNEYLKDADIPRAKKASIFLECQSLQHYTSIIDDLLKNRVRQSVIREYKDTIPIPLLEQNIYLVNLDRLDTDLHHYIAFIEGYGHYAERSVKVPTLAMAVLQCKNFLGKIYSKDIFAFCRHLFYGEAVRLCKNETSFGQYLLGIHNFDVAFRNRCFDVFIELKTRDIGIDMVKDNDRLYPPTYLDCLNQLLEDSEYAVNREEQFEQSQGSYAYDKQNFPGRPDVLKMSQYFVLYLRDKISSLTASANPTKIEHHYHDHSVHEDYSKHVNITPNE